MKSITFFISTLIFCSATFIPGSLSLKVKSGFSSQKEKDGLEGLTEDQLKALEAVMKPLRARIEEVLKTDKTGAYDQYLKDLEKTKKITDYAKKKVAFDALETKYLPFMKKVFASAQIDEAAYRKKVQQIIPKHIPYIFDRFLSLRSRDASDKPSGAKGKCSEATCPMGNDNGTGRTGIMLNFGTVVASGCNVKAEGSQLAIGGGECKAFLGKTLSIPTTSALSVKRVTATGDFHLGGVAIASGAAAYVETEIGIHYKTKKPYKLSWALAPVIFLVSYDDYLSVMELDFSTSGGNDLVQVTTRTLFTNVGVVSGSFGVAEGTIQKISVSCQ